MYNQATFSVQSIKNLLQSDFFSEKELDILLAFYSLENTEATSPELARYLGYNHFAPINSIVGRLGKRIAKELDIPLRIRENGKEAGWDVILEGKDGTNGFIWRLKSPISKALTELEYEERNIDFLISEELPTGVGLYEGLKQTITVNRFERNLLARDICIDHYGTICQACEFDFERTYGDFGKDFIHVHHLVPISEIGKEYVINPKQDLIPVCPNCHAMIHRKKDQTLTIEELKSIIALQSAKM